MVYRLNLFDLPRCFGSLPKRQGRPHSTTLSRHPDTLGDSLLPLGGEGGRRPDEGATRNRPPRTTAR
jgi:hypothetical protein